MIIRILPLTLLSLWCSAHLALAQDAVAPSAAPATLPEVNVPSATLPDTSADTATGEQPPSKTNNTETAPLENEAATEEKTANVETGSETPAEPEVFTPSYGTFEKSLFYREQDISRMKNVLEVYERVASKGEKTDIAVDEQNIDKLLEGLQDPNAKQEGAEALTEFPVYYIGSVLVRSPRDWVFWLNGERITPRTKSGEISVIAVSNKGVTLHWKPTAFREIVNAATVNKNSSAAKQYASLVQSVRVDEAEGFIQFTLRPNQTFSSKYLKVLEGKFEAEPFVAAAVTAEAGVAESSSPPQATKAPQALRQSKTSAKRSAPNQAAGGSNFQNVLQNPASAAQMGLGRPVANAPMPAAGQVDPNVAQALGAAILNAQAQAQMGQPNALMPGIVPTNPQMGAPAAPNANAGLPVLPPGM